jgi:hypothetical protein
MRNKRRLFSVFVSGFWLLATGFSCTQNAATTQPTTKPSSIRDRQDQALKDPFGYSPDAEATDISGGGLTDFDRGGFKKDLKNVLDP